MKRKLLRFLLLLQVQVVVLLFASAVPGQIRLYDPGNDELARKTREAFTDPASINCCLHWNQHGTMSKPPKMKFRRQRQTGFKDWGLHSSGLMGSLAARKTSTRR